MENTTPLMVTGMFPNKESAENAYDILSGRGYSKHDVNVIMSDDTRRRYFLDEPDKTEFDNKASEDAGKGTIIGGTLGAIAGIIAALGTNLIIPGLGLVIAGPLVAGLAGAGAGGIAGGVIGGLVGLGIPQQNASVYENGIKKGHIVMVVHPKNAEDAEYITNNWKAYKEEDIQV
jgi:hypothetical protein